MPGYLIKDTTKEERKQIVEESLGNISANCDGCMARLADMYQDYMTERKRSVRSIWSSMPGMSMEIWIKRKNEAARCSERRLTEAWIKMK